MPQNGFSIVKTCIVFNDLNVLSEIKISAFLDKTESPDLFFEIFSEFQNLHNFNI